MLKVTLYRQSTPEIMSEIISRQFEEARAEGHKITQEASLKYSVNINNRVFEISLKPDFPQSPPKIMLKATLLSTPITSNWIPVFTLSDVCEHLKAYDNVPDPKTFVVDENEIRNLVNSASYEQISTPEKIFELISKVQAVSYAQKYANAAKTGAAKAESNTAAISVAMFDLFEQVSTLEAKKQELTSKLAAAQSDPSRFQRESINRKVKQLWDDIAFKQNQLGSLTIELEAGRIGPDEYAKNLFALKQAISKNQMICAQLSASL